MSSPANAKLLLDPKNRVLSGLGDTKFNDGFRRNLKFLSSLWIQADASLPLLFHELAKARQDEFALLFDFFVGEVAEGIEEYCSGSFVRLGGSSECDLEFGLGHV